MNKNQLSCNVFLSRNAATKALGFASSYLRRPLQHQPHVIISFCCSHITGLCRDRVWNRLLLGVIPFRPRSYLDLHKPIAHNFCLRINLSPCVWIASVTCKWKLFLFFNITNHRWFECWRNRGLRNHHKTQGQRDCLGPFHAFLSHSLPRKGKMEGLRWKEKATWIWFHFSLPYLDSHASFALIIHPSLFTTRQEIHECPF